jgi:hypothetical protein
LLDACKSLFDGQGSGKEESFKDGIHRVTVTALDLDRSLADEFVEPQEILNKGRIGLLAGNDLH